MKKLWTALATWFARTFLDMEPPPKRRHQPDSRPVADALADDFKKVANDFARLVIKLTCEVCGKPAFGVAASPFGPISHAYCLECVSANREVYNTLLAGLAGCPRAAVAEWTKPFITATCAHYGKTEDQFWAEKDAMDREYDEYQERVAAEEHVAFDAEQQRLARGEQPK